MDAPSSLIQDSANRLFSEHITTALRVAAEAGDFPHALWNAVEAAGLPRALLPEASGGFGLGAAEALSLLTVAGAHAAPVPLAETMMAGWLLAQAGLEMPDGVLTVASSESLALSDGRLSGSAARIPWARDAAHIVVQLDGFVAIAAPASYTLIHGQNIAREPRDTVTFHGPATHAPAGVTADQFRLLGAAMRAQQLAGALGRVVETTVQYASDRIQFGRPIAKFQAIQHNLAILAASHAAASAAAEGAADAVEHGLRPIPIAAAKLRTGEAAGLAAGLAHQIHGAIGFTYEHHLHFLTKRLWSWRDEFGAEPEWAARIGRHIAAAGADNLWAEIVAA
jgi:acyl-CoA dehydrogenase